eukprot:1325024-Amorphochlora_amoeboformis.AAC.1
MSADTKATNLSLEQADEEMYKILKKEEKRQFCGLELIASEVGFLRGGKRYYGGNEFIDQAERISRQLRGLHCPAQAPRPHYGVRINAMLPVLLIYPDLI